MQMLVQKHPPLFSLARKTSELFLAQTAHLARNGDDRPRHFTQVLEVDLVDRVASGVIVRVEVRVGELLGEENGRPAVVEEPGVVAAILDAQVVSVEGRQIELVARNLLEERHGDGVRTVAVHFVVDVETVLGVRAVPDHVHLDHADNGKTLLLGFASEPVGVGVAAPQALLLAREVDDVNSAVETTQSDDGAGGVVERSRARAVIFGTRSRSLVIPRPPGGGIEVSAEHENLVGVLLAGDDVAHVIQLLAANLVGPQFSSDAGGLVRRQHERCRGVDAVGVRVAADNRGGDATQIERLSARKLAQHRAHVGDAQLVEHSLNARVRRREVVGGDERTGKSRSATLLILVVLAAARVSVTGVNRIELIERLVEGLVVAVTIRLGFGILTLFATDAGANEDDEQRESEER